MVFGPVTSHNEGDTCAVFSLSDDLDELVVGQCDFVLFPCYS